MKPPVLHVKKGSALYDDSRGEELTAASAVRDAAPAPRRRGRRRALTFLPLLVVVIAIAVAFQVVSRHTTASFPGWTAQLAVSPSGGVLDVAVIFTERPGTPARAAPAEPSAAVHILLPDTGASIDLASVLVQPSTTLRGQLPLLPAVRSVTADVFVGTDRRSLTAGVGSRR